MSALHPTAKDKPNVHHDVLEMPDGEQVLLNSSRGRSECNSPAASNHSQDRKGSTTTRKQAELRRLKERQLRRKMDHGVAGGERPFFAKIRSAIEMPGIGSLLYRLNVNSFVVGKMVAGHVYSDPNLVER